MTKLTPAIESELEKYGAVLVRRTKHYIYRLPNNRNVVISKSSGDSHFEKNVISSIRKQAAL